MNKTSQDKLSQTNPFTKQMGLRKKDSKKSSKNEELNIIQNYEPLTESARLIEQRKAKMGGTREFKRTLLNQQPTFNYMKGLARSEKKRGQIKEKYYKPQTKIRGD